MNIYLANNLNYKLNKFFKKNEYNKIIDLMNNDKKNDDKKINLILIKKDKLEKILSDSKIIITNNSAVLFYANRMGIKNINIIKNNINMIPAKYLTKIININSLK